MTPDQMAFIRSRWPENEASWGDVEALCLEIERLRREAQKLAIHAFNYHGDDAFLYNALADLGGVTPDGLGWDSKADSVKGA